MKTCEGCRAFSEIGKSTHCALGYERITRLKNNRIGGIPFICPAGKCPKPRTYSALEFEKQLKSNRKNN